MKELREILANNLYELRVASGLTQLAFAEKMNYSDKAVSKWERAESAPDIVMLKRIADFYGVSVDYLITEDHKSDDCPGAISEARHRVKQFISAISTVGVWLLATVYFIIHLLFFGASPLPSWMVFIYAIPLSATVALVFNAIWGGRRARFVILSVLVWSFILALHLTLLFVAGINLWLLYPVGAPAEVIILLVWGLISKRKWKGRK